MSVQDADKCTVGRSDLDAVFPVLRRLGYEIQGPTVRDGAIVYDSLESAAQLPSGWTEVQSPGTYRLRRREDEAVFGFAVGPHSWKRFLHHPAARLLQIRKNGAGWDIESNDGPPPRMAFVGVRACELHALSIRDRVLLKGKYADPEYRQARENIAIVAVHCSSPSGTCFCPSMNAGPRCPDGYDLALTEILEGDHRFVAETGTALGRRILKEIPHRPATQADLEAADAAVSQAERSITRTVNTRGLKQLLYATIEHPAWDRAAKTCMACGNCTMVCPTCFCTTVEDTSSVSGETAERWRFWDSCFSQQFSYIHGGSIRNSVSSRFRHRILHKFASWWEQFGTSGCVGCGRCITWCPAAIDLTAELQNIRETTRGGIA